MKYWASLNPKELSPHSFCPVKLLKYGFILVLFGFVFIFHIIITYFQKEGNQYESIRIVLICELTYWNPLKTVLIYC